MAEDTETDNQIGMTASPGNGHGHGARVSPELMIAGTMMMADESRAAPVEAAPENFTEGSKLLHDTFKNITTLSTGSILLLVTIIDRLFANPQGKLLIGMSMAFFIIAMLSATALMILIGDQLRGRGFYQRLPHTLWTRRFFQRFFDAELRLGAVFVVICVPSFVLAVACLIAFALVNFYQP
jgi:hypothetical protein